MVHELIEDIGAQNNSPGNCNKHLRQLIVKLMLLNKPVYKRQTSCLTSD